MSTGMENLQREVRQMHKRFDDMNQYLKALNKIKQGVEKVTSEETTDAEALGQAPVELPQLAQAEQIKQHIKEERGKIGEIENAILKLDENYTNKNNQFENSRNEKLLEQEESNTRNTTKDNYKGNSIHEITKNLSEIVFHENDTRIVHCNKNYQDVAISIEPHFIIDKVGLKDNRDKITAIQNELISKRVKFSDWKDHLFIYCKREAVEYCYDNRGNMMDWTDCIISFFQDVDFVEQNNRRLKELMNKTPSEGQNMREYCSEVIYQAQDIKGMAILPIILNKLDEAFAQAESQIVAPQHHEIDRLKDLYSFIKVEIPANMLTKTTLSTTPNLLEAQIKNELPSTVETYHFCNKCPCQKCKRLKYARPTKKGI